MYIAPGQGLTTPWWRNFDVNRNIFSLRSFVASFKNIFLKSDFIHFFMILYMYIAPGQGLTTNWGRNFDVNRNILSLRSFVASLKNISLKSDFIYFFHDFIHVYSPGAGADNPLGTKFWCQQEHIVTSVICCKFKKISLKSDFMLFFSWFIHVYSPRTGLTTPWEQNFDVNRYILSFRSFVASFKKTFIPPSHRSSTWNLNLIGPVVSEEKMFKECGRWRRTMEAYSSYKLTKWAFGSGELKNHNDANFPWNMVANIMLYNKGVWGLCDLGLCVWGLCPKEPKDVWCWRRAESTTKIAEKTDINLSESTDNATTTLALMIVYILTTDYYVAQMVQK